MSTETLTHVDTCDDQDRRCVSCQEHDCDRDWRDWNWTSTGEQICQGCYDQDLEYASTVIVFDPSESDPLRWLVGDHVTYDQHGDSLEDGISRVHHRTDAWRGYYETTIPGTVDVLSGADLYGTSTDVRDLAERIKDDHAEGLLPCRVYVVVDLTSNVFATAMTIRVHAGDVWTFDAWRNGESQGEEE